MKVAISGAGLSGTLLSILLAKQGYDITIYDMREDFHSLTYSIGGKRTPLDISYKGIIALKKAGVWEDFTNLALRVCGRDSYSGNNPPNSYNYPLINEHSYVYSIEREFLHKLLLSELNKYPNIKLYFKKQLSLNLDNKLINKLSNHKIKNEFDVLVDCSGFRSAIVKSLEQKNLCTINTKEVGYEYKEIELPSEWVGALNPTRFHFWNSSCTKEFFIVQPNKKGKVLGTLILKNNHFKSLNNRESIEKFWTKNFPSLVELIDYITNSLNKYQETKFYTKKVKPWGYKNIIAIGDAVHTMVPFLGQGVNCAFNDALELSYFLENRSSEKIETLLNNFYQKTKKNADAILDLSEIAYQDINFMQDLRDQIVFTSQSYFETLNRYKSTIVHNNIFR
jgi:kynurenine 3-monooxygenase